MKTPDDTRKTPNDIKKGLKCCAYETCNGCPYEGDGCGTNREMIDALEYIQQLEARIDTLTAKAVLFDEAVAAGEKMKRERDAAIEDLETMGEARAYCDTCIHYNTYYKEEPCSSCMSGYLINNWQWRGIQEVE